MSEQQRDLTPDERAERDRLVARLTEAANVVRQAKAVMGDANAEIDRLRADLAAERERAVQAEAGAGQLRVALTKIRQTDYGIIDDPYPDMSSEACFRCETMHEIADAALADPAGREWLAAADGTCDRLESVAQRYHSSQVSTMHSGQSFRDCTDVYCRENAAALARWSALRGQM